MGIIHILKSILLIFEFLVFFFIAAIMVFSGFNQIGLPHVAFAASAVLFPLMALFIWLDNTRYRVYMPLFTAGKCVGVFSVLGWSIIARQVKIKAVLSGAAAIESILLYSYLFSVIVILVIIRDKKLNDDNINDVNHSDVIHNDVNNSDEKKLEVE